MFEVGMRFEDIERGFMTGCAARGNTTSFIIAGVFVGRLPHGEIVPGEALLVDAVSHFRQYHGDFGRTVAAGDPTREVLRRAKAEKLGRNSIFEKPEPGITYSQIRKFGYEAMVRAGMVITPDIAYIEPGWAPDTTRTCCRLPTPASRRRIRKRTRWSSSRRERTRRAPHARTMPRVRTTSTRYPTRNQPWPESLDQGWCGGQ
jgi:hypothetical protein